ncbi:C-C motif chemokine 27a isoform X1 [Ictalurus punctatus]|uniref:C-C motif chemokine 27a isoform X1 n=1 Tax=Ictalurus punctatus TaxID=7998 RepID=A0A2D0QWB8_ICTPU|nr:C-C motif chemokine 27a isoform X1 [Ictalurus punctatus]
MELRTAAVLLLFLCASIFITTEAGLIPNCCLSTRDKISRIKIKNAQKYDLQSDAGPCEVKALILHVGKKRFCLDPKLEKMVKRGMRKMNMHGPKQKSQ